MRKITLIVSILFLLPLISFAETWGSNFLTSYDSCTQLNNDYGTTYDCNKAVDGNTATRWGSNVIPNWVKYDMAGSYYALGKWDITIYGANGDYMNKNMEISGSNDDSNWSVIGSSLVLNTGADKSVQEFILTTSTKAYYRYYKFLMSDSYLSNNTSMWEIGAYECMDCEEPAQPPATSTSTLSAGDMVLWQIFYILDGLVFVGLMIGLGYLLKKVFRI